MQILLYLKQLKDAVGYVELSACFCNRATRGFMLVLEYSLINKGDAVLISN